MSRKYESHVWQDKSDLAHNIKAAKKKALEAKKKREAFARAELERSAKAAFDADVCFSIQPSTESDEDITLYVSKASYSGES